MRLNMAENTRVYAELRELSYDETHEFFRIRTAACDARKLSATMYQTDEIASMRDKAEKELIIPLLNLHRDDTVLDIGCGNGRWAQTAAGRVRRYTGIDFSADLVRAARESIRFADFYVMAAHEFRRDQFPDQAFSLIILSGILAYLNDRDVKRLLVEIAAVACPAARIYLREPMGVKVRLTLDRFWSDELAARYSAVYRTRDEYAALLSEQLLPAGFRVAHEGFPFERRLQNRTDTEQYFIILSR